ncbi:MAG: hypothetical protein J6I98_03350 [Clostridia bacterium]|nr:hypothetical protein [Clostridia bacterium]
MVTEMEFDVKTLNQIISDYESSGEISDAELDWLENAVLSGAVQGLSKQGLPLLGMRAKTKLFESNFYALESVRILSLNGRKERLQAVIEGILQHLEEKCYGQFCPTGECYETSVCVLRFLRAVCPWEEEWIAQMEAGIRAHREDKARTKAVQRYIESALR